MSTEHPRDKSVECCRSSPPHKHGFRSGCRGKVLGMAFQIAHTTKPLRSGNHTSQHKPWERTRAQDSPGHQRPSTVITKSTGPASRGLCLFLVSRSPWLGRPSSRGQFGKYSRMEMSLNSQKCVHRGHHEDFRREGEMNCVVVVYARDVGGFKMSRFEN